MSRYQLLNSLLTIALLGTLAYVAGAQGGQTVAPQPDKAVKDKVAFKDER